MQQRVAMVFSKQTLPVVPSTGTAVLEQHPQIDVLVCPITPVFTGTFRDVLQILPFVQYPAASLANRKSFVALFKRRKGH